MRAVVLPVRRGVAYGQGGTGRDSSGEAGAFTGRRNRRRAAGRLLQEQGMESGRAGDLPRSGGQSVTGTT